MTANKVSTLTQHIRSLRHKSLAAKISLLAFVVEALIIFTNKTGLNPDDFGSMLLAKAGAAIFFGILGLAGLVVVVRQELQQGTVVRGRSAIIHGLIWCTISWLLMIGYIYAIVVDLMKPPL